MSTEETIAVNIVIADRTYRIKVKPSDEEAVRKSLKLINDKIIEFKTRFAGRDMQDYIAMVMIWFATEGAASSQNALEVDNIREKLSKIVAQLNEVVVDGR